MNEADDRSAAAPAAVSSTDRSAAVPAAVSGASRPRLNEIKFATAAVCHIGSGMAAAILSPSRLCDSLPQHVKNEIAERLRLSRAANNSGRELLECEVAAHKKLSAKQFEGYLDAGSGKCELRNPEVAACITEALKLWHGKRYRLFAWCVMPNHVHVVFRLVPGEKLSAVVSAWKSYTAHKANEKLGRTGHFWHVSTTTV